MPSDAQHRVQAGYAERRALPARHWAGRGGAEEPAHAAGRQGRSAAQGGKVAILSFGSMLAPALQAAEQLDATVANMRFVKPLDEELVLQLARTHDLLVTVEENTIQAGPAALWRNAWHSTASMSPCCIWVCPIRSWSRGIRRRCWPTAGWTRQASPAPYGKEHRVDIARPK